jgi:hypothetical protein
MERGKETNKNKGDLKMKSIGKGALGIIVTSICLLLVFTGCGSKTKASSEKSYHYAKCDRCGWTSEHFYGPGGLGQSIDAATKHNLANKDHDSSGGISGHD